MLHARVAIPMNQTSPEIPLDNQQIIATALREELALWHLGISDLKAKQVKHHSNTDDSTKLMPLHTHT